MAVAIGAGENTKRHTKKIFVALLIAAVIALSFWSQSRVPALNEKAMMGQRTLVGTLAFDIVLPVAPDYPWYQRIAYTTVNWSYTNWKGMTFGVLFAAAFLALLSYFPRQQFRSSLLNTLKGVVTGVPLGVCVNCATPIAHGMHQAGVRLETVLATLVSSPTLNVIVLTMSFSLLPFQFALAKLLFVLLFVLAVIPLVARLGRGRLDGAAQARVETELDGSFYRKSLVRQIGESTESCDTGDRFEPVVDTWSRAISAVVADYFRALWFVSRTTIPFMLLAGLLGAIVVELLPVSDLASLPPYILIVLLVAVIGTFLPVPIAFDVVMVSLLIGSGVPPLFTMTLLFTLGVFSIYPFLVLWRNVSIKISMALFISVASLGVGSGYALQAYEEWVSEKVIAVYEKNVEQSVAPLQQQEDLPPDRVDSYTQNIEIATRICSQHEHPFPRTACLADFIFSEFGRGSDDGLCQAVAGDENRGMRDYCYAEYKARTIMARAEEKEDPSICQELTQEAKRFACLEKVVIARIKTGGGLKLCRELPAASLIASCLQKGIVIRLDKFNDAESCNQFDSPRERENCFSNAKILKLALGRRFEDCDALADPGERMKCRRVVAFSSIDDGADAGVCEGLSDASLVQECTAHAATVQAAKEEDQGICDSINNPAQREVCKRVAINRQITGEIDRAASVRIGDIIKKMIQAETGKPGSIAHNPGSGKRLREVQFHSAGNLSVSYLPYGQRRQGGKGFSRHTGEEFGISDVWRFSFLEFVSPFMVGRGIAAGDFNNDNWPDLLLAANDGVHLFRNTGEGGFAYHPLDLADLVPRDAYVVALVDVNNDGWQDIFVTGYGGRVVTVLNDGEGFKNPNAFNIENKEAILAISAGFVDLDRDSDLDLLLGNWSFGEDKSFLENYSGNRLLMNTPIGFQAVPLDEIRGDSLSVLFSDLDGDGIVDLAVGNDREIPDNYYFGVGAGNRSRISSSDGRIPVTPFNTMNIDSADFNNDLHLDIFSTDMTFSKGAEEGYCEALEDPGMRDRCRLLLEGSERIEHRDYEWCMERKSKEDREACLTAVYRNVAIATHKPDLCSEIPDRYLAHREYCINIARKDKREEKFSVPEELDQRQSNILLLGGDDGRFRDATDSYGVGSSFWTWNAKAADLDNDGWQDIYVGNGFRFGEGKSEIHSNLFFHNENGERFSTAQAEFGLEDYVNTPSYVSVDFDLDGDLDIVATGVLSPVRVFINKESKNNAISFALRDGSGNSFGIGSRIYIHYADGGEEKHQVRELKASGGFMSFDAPIAHFGLGALDEVSRVEIVWSTGERTLLDRPFPANRHYIIKRGASKK